MINVLQIANKKKNLYSKVDASYNRNFQLARLNLELYYQEKNLSAAKEILQSAKKS